MFDDPVGLFAALRNIMVLALLRPTYEWQKATSCEVPIPGHTLKIEQFVVGWECASVILCNVWKEGSDG